MNFKLNEFKIHQYSAILPAKCGQEMMVFGPKKDQLKRHEEECPECHLAYFRDKLKYSVHII